jgi:hypothetical protein
VLNDLHSCRVLSTVSLACDHSLGMTVVAAASKPAGCRYSAANRGGCRISSASACGMVPTLSPGISVASSSSVVYR